MPTLTIRNLPQPIHDALRRRAAEHRRSMEAEARALLGAAVAPAPTDLSFDERLARLQQRAIADFGGEQRKRGEVERFLRDRRASWDE